MELEAAKQLAYDLMDQHGLTFWSFRFDDAVRRFGMCDYMTRTISLSSRLVELNDDARVKDTILHEIAHALVGPGHGHNLRWKRQARFIGCDGERCYSPAVVNRPPLPLTATCSHCGATFGRVRQPRNAVACTACCRKHNGGKFSYEFAVTFTRRP